MVIHMGNADHTFPEPGQGMFLYVLPQDCMERVNQEQAALARFLFGQQAGHCHFQDAVFKTDFNAVGFPCLNKVLRLLDGSGGIKKAPELAGNPFGPQGGFG